MTPQTIAFFGASGGVGLAALKQALASQHTCIALCRNPQKLLDIFPADSQPNLHIVTGNAHDIAAVSKCLVLNGRFVDVVVSTIGGRFDTKKFAFEDEHVCTKGTQTLLESLKSLRAQGFKGRPYIVVCSTTGISRFKRDVPLLMLPFYATLSVPHDDKRVMEDLLIASDEDWTAVRPSLLTDGGVCPKGVRVGVEDPHKGVLSEVVGYAISREDTGRWIVDSLVKERWEDYVGRCLSISY
jgi:putative NADH-flavin reductase